MVKDKKEPEEIAKRDYISVTSPVTTPPITGPKTVWLFNPSGVCVDGIPVDWKLRQTMDDAGITKPPLAGKGSASRVEMILTENPFTSADELFYQRGWTDGLPIVPPIDTLLGEMLKGTNLAPDYVVATLEPMGGQATVEKIAVNAVMAGCRPEYMPILIPAVEAIADPAFNLWGVSTTTNPDGLMLIINGPVAQQLNINSGPNALGGVGWRANAAIGRALHFVARNIGGSWPGVSRMATLGQPGQYSMCLAENEAANPWQPLDVELGFTNEQGTVTVVPAEGTQLVVDIGVDAEGFLSRVVNSISRKPRPITLIIAPFTASKLVKAGFNKESIRKFVNDNTTTPPKHLTIIVAGGIGEKNMLIPNWCVPISRKITLPPNWNELIKRAETDLGPNHANW